MKNLTQVDNFGAVDADNDDLLLISFEDHEAYKDIIEFRRFLIIGRKGSGKTAIYKKILTKSEDNYFCFGHTFSDYPWDYHDKQARIGIPDFDKYTHSWKYLIFITLSKIALNYDQTLPFDDASHESLIRLEKFVLDSYGTRDPDITQIFSPGKTLHIKPSLQMDWSIIKAGISPEMYPISELPNIVQDVNKDLLQHILTCLNPNNKYFVCFDQLDLGFDPNTPDYNNRLIGLLLACRDINSAAKQHKKNLFITIFLRDDIYKSLQFEDKNKITENHTSVIEWDTTRNGKTLKELMQKRFTAVLGDSTSQQNVTWNDVFNESNEMPGRQSKYAHITDRTYLRPRDIIKFINTVLKAYKDRIAEGENITDKIENIDIQKARPQYSDYLLRELDDEIHKHIPNYSKYLDAIRSIGKWHFSLTDFKNKYESTYGANFKASEALQELYEFSIIGFLKSGGRGHGGSEYVFKYKEPATKFDSNATKFRVHAGLIESLGLKKVTGEENKSAGNTTLLEKLTDDDDTDDE